MRAVLLALLVAGCGSQTPVGDDSTIVVGRWQYDARQTTPALELSGELRIEEQNNGRIEGELNAQEKDAQGVVRNRAGIINGTMHADGSIDFYLLLQGTARRHVGRVRNDSISGTWVEQVSSGVPLTGPFTARRVR